MLNLIYFCLSLQIIASQGTINLNLKKTLNTLSATFQIDQLDVELAIDSHSLYTTLYCQDLKSSYNFCTKFNNTFLPCDQQCERCKQKQCLGEYNYETGEYAKFVYQEIIIEGIKVIDRIQVFQQQFMNRSGTFSIAKKSYLMNKLVELNKIDHLISFKNCMDDIQLIIGQDISKTAEKLDMFYDDKNSLPFISLLGVGINNILFPYEQQAATIFIELNYFTFQQDLADNIYQLVFGRKAGSMISPCISNYSDLFNITFIFDNNQSILLQPEDYYFKQNNEYCIPIAGNQCIFIQFYYTSLHQDIQYLQIKHQ